MHAQAERQNAVSVDESVGDLASDLEWSEPDSPKHQHLEWISDPTGYLTDDDRSVGSIQASRGGVSSHWARGRVGSGLTENQRPGGRKPSVASVWIGPACSETTVGQALSEAGWSPSATSDSYPAQSPSRASSGSPRAAAATRAAYFLPRPARSLELSSVVDSGSVGASPGSESDAGSGGTNAADRRPAAATAFAADAGWPGAAFSVVSERALLSPLPRPRRRPGPREPIPQPELGLPAVALFSAAGLLGADGGGSESDDSVGSCDSDGSVVDAVSGPAENVRFLTYMGVKKDVGSVPVTWYG